MNTSRILTPLDRCIAELDRTLRSAFPSATHTASRPNPAAAHTQDDLNVQERQLSGRLMRVNHAGEVAAQALYHGQALTARSNTVRSGMAQSAAEEVDHLAWCEQRLQELDTGVSKLDPIWYLGSLAIGALAAQPAHGSSTIHMTATVTGLLAFIPNLGALIAGILMVLVGFSGGVDMGIYTIMVYFLVQTFDGYVVIPLIAKKTVDLAPALVLGAQLVMGVLFGIIGLFLADPLLAMIKVALERRAEQNQEDEQELLAEGAGR